MITLALKQKQDIGVVRLGSMRASEITEASWYQDVRLQPKRMSTKKPRKLLPKPTRKIIVKRPKRVKSHMKTDFTRRADKTSWLAGK